VCCTVGGEQVSPIAHREGRGRERPANDIVGRTLGMWGIRDSGGQSRWVTGSCHPGAAQSEAPTTLSAGGENG